MVFRIDVPLAVGSSENIGSHFGMGDLLIGGRGKLALTEKLSWILGTNFILDTASNEVLGSGWNQIIPTSYLAWKPSRPWIFAMGYEYAASFGDNKRENKKISESLFRPGALYHLPHGYWFWLDPKTYVNQEQRNSTAFVLESEFGKVITGMAPGRRQRGRGRRKGRTPGLESRSRRPESAICFNNLC